VAGRAFGIKMGGDGSGGTVSLDGVASTRAVSASDSIIAPCTIKSRNNDGRRWGNPAKHCVYDDLIRINCGKAGDFGLVPGILIH